MGNFARLLGNNIRDCLKKQNKTIEEFSNDMGYSIQEGYKIIEGRILIPPNELNKISNYLHCEKESLLLENSNLDKYQFSNQENLDFILDLIDDYIYLRENIAI